jgi:hypothetical protein
VVAKATTPLNTENSQHRGQQQALSVTLERRAGKNVNSLV